MELIKDLIQKPLERILEKVEKEVVQVVYNRIFEYQIEEYSRNYYTKTILHRSEPVKLNDFYQPLFIRKFGRNNKEQRISTHSVKELFQDNQHITLLGTAGSGKSTIIKYLVVNCFEEKFKIPIKVELRYLNKFNDSLHKYITNEVFRLSQLAFEEDIVQRLLHSGDFLFFFDGYDELSSAVKERISKDINDFTRIYSKNSYLLTSRPYTNVELLAKFKNFEVCELNEGEIEQFVRKQIPATEKEIASKIIEAITKEDNVSYETFLSNPLLLSMFILTFQTYSNIPPKRSTFYKQVFDSLFHLHDSMSKLAYDREKRSGLSKDQFEQILKMFSFISFFKEMFVFEESYVTDTFNQIKQFKKGLQFDNLNLIDDLQIAICILNKEGLDYVFPHRSLQEYFASLYIVSLENKQKGEVYKKILTQFTKYDTHQLLTKDNFFTLLIEQDEVGVVRYLSIPFFENTYEQTKETIKEEKIDNIMNTVSFFYYSFHRDWSYFNDLSKILKEYSIKRNEIYMPIITRWDFKKGAVEITEEEQTNLRENSFKSSRLMRGTLSKVIKELKNHLKEEEISTASIIDLV